MCAEERPHEDPESGHCLQARKRPPPQKTTLPVPCSWTSSLQNREKIKFSYLSHPVYGILLWQPELTDTDANTWISVPGSPNPGPSPRPPMTNYKKCFQGSVHLSSLYHLPPVNTPSRSLISLGFRKPTFTSVSWYLSEGPCLWASNAQCSVCDCLLFSLQILPGIVAKRPISIRISDKFLHANEWKHPG